MLKPAISADSHIVEPPHCYTDFIEPQYRDRAPQMVETPAGGHIFNIPGVEDVIPVALLGAAGVPANELGKFRNATFAELPKAAWDLQITMPTEA